MDRFDPPSLQPGESYLYRLHWAADRIGRVRLEARLEGAPIAESWVEIKKESAAKTDVALSWLASPPTGCLGQGPWTAQIGVVNKGTATSREGSLLFLVNGKTADRAPIPALSPGQQLLITFTWRGARPGPNRLTAELDQEAAREDSDPDNNRIVQDFVFKKCQPDLSPVSLKLAGKVEPGRRPARATAVIANLGGVAAEFFRVRFLIDGKEIGGFDLGRLEPGRRRAVKIDWMPPRPGTYTLAVEVEVTSGTGEVERANNRREVVFTTLDDLPDLTLVRPDLPLNLCFKEDPIRVRTEVINRGRRISDRTEIVLRNGTRVAASTKLEPLPPGGSVFLDLEWKPRERGGYRLFVVVDPGDLVKESNENNNSVLVQVRLRDCRPDLIISSVKVADRLGAEESSRRILFSVHNRGGRTSPKTKAAVMIDDERILEVAVEPVQPASSRQYEAVLPRLKSGPHNLRILADPEGEVEEISRGNNDFVKRIESQPGRVDLRIAALTTDPAVPVPGSPLKIKARVANDGAGVKRAEVAFKLNGREIGRKFLSGLWAKGEKEVALELDGAPEEISSLEAVADPDNLIEETNEGNNSLKIQAPPAQ